MSVLHASAPYRFALRAAAFGAVALACLAALDRLAPALPASWLRAIPNMPEQVLDLARAHGQVLYLGDSVVFWTDRDSAPSLAEMVQIALDRPVVAVTHGAHAMDTFLAQIEYLHRAGRRPAAVVVPVNLRSFSPTWERNPSWNFAMQNRMYSSPLLTRVLAVLEHDFGGRRRLSYRRPVVEIAGLQVNVLDRRQHTRAAKPAEVGRLTRERLLIRYGAEVRASLRYGALRRLLRRLDASDQPALLYITPLDVQTMARVLTPDEVARIEGNLAVVRALLGAHDTPWLDLSHALSTEDFNYPAGNPNEHLSAAGRRRTAERIAAGLAGLLDDEAP